MSLSRNQLNDYLSTINIEGKTVLDVGVQDKPTSRLCLGRPTAYITLDVDPQWQPDIVADLNENVEDANLNHWQDVWELKKGSDYYPKKFDLIFCIEVLEHCWNPVQAIRNLSGSLEAGGDLYLSVPFINPHHDKVDYLRYTNEWFRDVLPKFGLEVIEIVERVATLGKTQLKIFYDAEGLRVSKIRPEYGKYSYPIGYIVHARKGTL